MNRKQPPVKSDNKSIGKNTNKSNTKITETPEIFGSNKEILDTLISNRFRLKCKNEKQKEYVNLISENEIVFCAGPAGVGKSFLAIARAIELLQNKSNKYERLIIVNPAVEAEEKLGFIPGSVREKLEPYVASSIDIIDKIIGSKNRKTLEASGIIKVEALAFIRGKTIDDSILVMEESQNMSPNQMKTLVTRIGENSKFIISGDLDQSDRYSDFTKTGLYDAMNRFKNINGIAMFKFNVEDVVRNPIISKLLKRYSDSPIESKKTISEPIKTKSEVKEIPTPVIYDKQNKLMSFFKRTFKW